MNITVLATGSRGDVQPFFALAYALQQAGHKVDVISNAHFAPLLSAYGLTLKPISWDARETLRRAPGPWRIRLASLLSDLRRSWQSQTRVFEHVLDDTWQAGREAKNLVYSFIAPWGYNIAEKLGIPSIVGSLNPVYPTCAFPMQFMPVNLGKRLNLVSHSIGIWGLWLILRSAYNRVRQQNLGLPAIKGAGGVVRRMLEGEAPLLHSLSPTVISRPADWPDRVHMDGYWFLPQPAGWQPPVDLVDFIQREDTPVYIGYGSMVYPNAEKMGQIALQALKLAGLRGVLSRGWGGLQAKDCPENVFLIDEIPHDWLFPQMRAVVHHGGAGTTAAGLRAGVPAVVVPYMQDQPYWARKLVVLGVSPTPIAYSRITAKKLAHRLIEVTRNQTMQVRARQLGVEISAEKGVEKAVGVIEAYFSS